MNLSYFLEAALPTTLPFRKGKNCSILPSKWELLDSKLVVFIELPFILQELLPFGTITSNTNLVLVNAVYFKGGWLNPFEEIPQGMEFDRGDSGPVPVPAMTVTATFRTGSVPQIDADILELPYQGDKASMVIVLPKNDMVLTERLIVSESSVFNDITNHFNQSSYVEVQMPKFKIESTHQLKLILAQMGVTDMFDPMAADFSGLFEGNDVRINADEAVQKAYIRVDENGTEAAAATAINFRTTAFRESTLFKIDRPFMFMIRVKENDSGLNLFIGKVFDPSIV